MSVGGVSSLACFGGVKLAILLDKLAVWYRTLYCSYLMHLYVSIHVSTFLAVVENLRSL